MKVVFMGTPQFAVPTLKALSDAGHDIACVITQPDRPAGRGHKLAPPPVKIAAQALGLRVEQPVRVSSESTMAMIKDMEPDVAVVAAFGQKIKPELLAIPRYGFVNVHPSLLPLYRGAAPIQRSMMNGDELTGVTIMYMDEGWDSGDIGIVQHVSVPDDATGTQAEELLADVGGELMVHFLRLLEQGQAPRIPQDDSQATYAPKITDADTVVDWNTPARAIRQRIRALSPDPAVRCVFEGIRVKILGASLVPAEWHAPEGALPGQLWPQKQLGLIVSCGADGREGLILDMLQPAGGRAMGGAEFARGRRIEAGRRLDS